MRFTRYCLHSVIVIACLTGVWQIVGILGTPNAQDWPEGHKLANAMHFRFPQVRCYITFGVSFLNYLQMVATPLRTIVTHASKGALDLMQALMEWNPAKRPTCVQALRFPFFTDGEPIPEPIENVHSRPANNAGGNNNNASASQTKTLKRESISFSVCYSAQSHDICSSRSFEAGTARQPERRRASQACISAAAPCTPGKQTTAAATARDPAKTCTSPITTAASALAVYEASAAVVVF